MFRCEQCKKTLGNKKQVVGIILRGTRLLKVCPECYGYIHNKEIEALNISKQELATSGLLEKGYKQEDVKQLLKKWTKQQSF